MEEFRRFSRILAGLISRAKSFPTRNNVPKNKKNKNAFFIRIIKKPKKLFLHLWFAVPVIWREQA